MRRALDGVLLLDKPSGLSSNQALGRAKYLLAAKKAGHTGTLDPLASGLLPLCFGEATKFSADLLNATKRYAATLRLGERTTTGDAEGEILQKRRVTCDLPAVQRALAQLRGDILQIPPMYSALKRDGKPLYEYARAGVTLERAARLVTIYELELISYRLPEGSSQHNQIEEGATLRPSLNSIDEPHESQAGLDKKASPDLLDDLREEASGEAMINGQPELQIIVSCSKGTYIRVLAEEIGELLGCGAHLTALRRTGVGTLDLTDAISLDTLEATEPAQRLCWLQPLDTLLATSPIVHLDRTAALRFKQGQRLKWVTELTLETNSVAESNQSAIRVRVYDEKAQFLGTANFFEGTLAPLRLVMP